MSLFDNIYQNAAVRLGRPERELRDLAQTVFATMLFHAAAADGKESIYTIIRMNGKALEIEVNCFPPRNRLARFSI